MPVQLNIVTALLCEAHPLIRRFDLEAVRRKGARTVYRGKGLALAVSGVGRKAAGEAVRDLAEWSLGDGASGSPSSPPIRKNSAWLNVGIGGHGVLPQGQGVLAHRVESTSNATAWFPRFVFPPPCPTANVRTTDQVERDYSDPVVYEMEAVGFMEAASSLASAELVHVCKVVSDGPSCSPDELNHARIESIIEANIEEIARIADTLQSLVDELDRIEAHPPGWETCLDRWHFTETQRHQLRSVLIRWNALMQEPPPWETFGENLRGRDILRGLEAALQKAPVRLVPSRASS